MTDLTNLEIAWFDLGLSKGKQVERERIIKLIENNMMGRDSWLDVIELIKGEQK